MKCIFIKQPPETFYRTPRPWLFELFDLKGLDIFEDAINSIMV